MKALFPPPIDGRDADAIVRQVGELLRSRADSPWADWNGAADPLSFCLVQIFGDYAATILERLNRAPDHNFLAYLEFLGAQRRPPRPARVPVTFLTPKQTPPGQAITVPKGSEIAAPAGGERLSSAVFHTEADLDLTPLRLKAAFFCSPAIDALTVASLPDSQQEPNDLERRLIGGLRPLKHALLIGCRRLPEADEPTVVRLRVVCDRDAAASVQGIRWSALGPEGSLPLIPLTDTTKGLTRTGEIVFDSFPGLPLRSVNGIESRWLCGSLEGRIPRGGASRIRRIQIAAETTIAEAPVEKAIAEGLPVDVRQELFPFGQIPRLGACFYLSSATAFAEPGSEVSIGIELAFPASDKTAPSPPRVYAGGQPQVRWEYWNGRIWSPLPLEGSEKSRFLEHEEFSFAVPADLAPCEVSGIEGRWIRARLAQGDYGSLYRFEQDAQGIPRPAPPTLSPPITRSIQIAVRRSAGFAPPDAVLTLDGLSYRTVRQPGGALPLTFAPFRQDVNAAAGLFVGLQPPEAMSAEERSVHLFLDFEEAERPPVLRSLLGREDAAPAWEFWDGSLWKPLAVFDQTRALGASGPVRFLLPTEAKPWKDNAWTPDLCWVRAVWRESAAAGSPPSRILINTAWAIQSTRIEQETLGSSNGRPYQRFQAARRPVLGDPAVEVRENGVWARWLPVNGLWDSRPDDPHYTLEFDSGEIAFGDGLHGRIPEAGSNNVRIVDYQTAEGRLGNVEAGEITQLRTAIPFVRGVENRLPAQGGADADGLDTVRSLGPRMLRHRDRAVTREDFEDLALASSPEVERARCVPLWDSDAARAEAFLRTGLVSLTIVPRTERDRPTPTLALLERVRAYLDARRDCSAELVLTGPDYLSVDVSAALLIDPEASAGTILRQARQALRRYLHPLRGGADGNGWAFQKLPNRSDFYPLLGGIPGVVRVDEFEFRARELQPGSIRRGNWLPSCGEPALQVRMAPAGEVPQPKTAV